MRYSSAIAIHWSSGDPGKGPITRYVIEARPSGGSALGGPAWLGCLSPGLSLHSPLPAPPAPPTWGFCLTLMPLRAGSRGPGGRGRQGGAPLSWTLP